MIKIVITVGVALALGIIAGSAAVYTFNRMPDGWLGADEEGRDSQRVKSVPWKYVLSATFIVCGIYTGLKDPAAAPAVFAACFLLAQTAIAAKLYRRAPLQISALILLCGIAKVAGEADFQRYVIEAVVSILLLGALMGIVMIVRKAMGKTQASEHADAPAGTAVSKRVPVHETFALAASIILICGGPQGICVIAAATCMWMIRVLIVTAAERKGKADVPYDFASGSGSADGQGKAYGGAGERVIVDALAAAEPPAFFIAIAGAVWIALNISHVIL